MLSTGLVLMAYQTKLNVLSNCCFNKTRSEILSASEREPTKMAATFHKVEREINAKKKKSAHRAQCKDEQRTTSFIVPSLSAHTSIPQQFNIRHYAIHISMHHATYRSRTNFSIPPSVAQRHHHKHAPPPHQYHPPTSRSRLMSHPLPRVLAHCCSRETRPRTWRWGWT